MAKKLIRVEKHPDCPGVYGNNIDSSFCMSILSNAQKTDDKGFDIRQRATCFSSCREILTSSIRAMVDPTNTSLESSSSNQNLKEFDFEKLRLFIGTKIGSDADLATYKKRLFAGKRALNLLEAYAGWTPQSVISTVVSTESKDKAERYWMVTGPKEWMSAPQLLSLGVLILRMCMFCGEFEHVEEVNTESVEAMLAHLKQLADNTVGRSSSTTRASRFFTDAKYFVEVYDHILPILKNHKKLFYKDLKDNWPPNNRGFGGYGGITSYSKCNTGDSTMTSKLKSLVLNAK